MAVRKKIPAQVLNRDRIISPQVLDRVKKAISNLPDEGAEMEQAQEETGNPSKKKVTKKAAKKVVKKVVAAKSKKTDSDLITLSEICKGLKMEPRTARKVLRTNEVEVEGGRWSWKKGSADAQKIEKMLKKHAAGEE